MTSRTAVMTSITTAMTSITTSGNKNFLISHCFYELSIEIQTNRSVCTAFTIQTIRSVCSDCSFVNRLIIVKFLEMHPIKKRSLQADEKLTRSDLRAHAKFGGRVVYQTMKVKQVP